MLRKLRNFAVPETHNPFQPVAPAGLGMSLETQQFEEAIVTDVIVNNDHPDYASDGYNVGMVKIRRLTSNSYRSENQLQWAFPMPVHVSTYPLIGEIVLVFQSLNRTYYLEKMNVSSKVTSHEISDLLSETDQTSDNNAKINDYQSSTLQPKKVNGVTRSLGKYFTENPDNHRLKHFEGDTVFEGRTGQSIRFGSSWIAGNSKATANNKTIPWQSLSKDQSPSILMRVGPTTKTYTVNSSFGQTIENINTDDSSFWMVSDQIIPIKLATDTSKLHKISISDFPSVFGGNQIVLNSNRIILNSKKDKILLHSNLGIHLTSLQDITSDTDGNHITWTTGNKNDRVVGSYKFTVGSDYDVSVKKSLVQKAHKHTLSSETLLSMLAKKVHIGSENSSSEPLVLGATLVTMLSALIDILTTEPIILATGMPGAPSVQNPARVTKLQQLKAQYLSGGSSASVLSLDNFTIRTNASPLTLRNISKYSEE